MIRTAPSPIDLLDFQFKLQCRLKIFQNENSSTFDKACNIVAVASRYGLLFVGTNSSSFQVIQLQGIQKYNVKDGEITNYLRRTVSLPSNPQHLSVNCDCTKLSVVVKEDECVKAIVYDISSFLQQNISISSEIRLSPTPGVTVIDTVWNPTLPSVYTVCRNDGSLGVYDLKPTGIEINELPKAAGATCICWSPKGKQIAVGSHDGKITQYKPDLKVAKIIEAPPLEGSQLPTALQWISNYQFIAIYRTNNNDAQCSLLVVNCPKSGEVTYVNYDDICYSYGSARPYQFYMLLQNTWNVLMVASSNSMEVGVLGFEKDIWTQWILADSSRAELPLSSTKQDTLPIGLSLDTSSVEPISWGESTIPPTPLLLLLSDHGVLCCFHAINLKEGAAQICRAPEVAPNNLAGAYFTEPPATIGTMQPSKPVPINPTKQNVPPSIQQPAATTLSFTFKPSPNPITTTANIFQQTTTQPFSFSTTAMITKTEKTSSQLQPNIFSTNSKPTPTTSETFLISTDKTALGNFTAKIQPPQQSVPEVKSFSGAQPAMTKMPSKPEIQDVASGNEDTENLIAQMVKEECIALELELKALLHQGQNIKVDLGTDNEATNLVQNTNNLQEFLDEIDEICQTQSVEVLHLKQALIQTWAWYEEAKSRFTSNKDPALITLMRAQPLDAASARQLQEIRHLLYYLESQLTQANGALDEQWETFQDSCKKKLSLKLPSMEAIYQSMVKQSATIQKEVYILKDISNRIKARARSSTVPHLLVSLDGADILEEQLKTLTIHPKDLVHLQYERVFNRQKQLSSGKIIRLKNFFKSRHVVHVSVSKPQLTNSAMQLSGLINAPFSPIVPSKKIQPQRLNFVQSTPKSVDNQLNKEFKKLQPINDVPEVSMREQSGQESKSVFEAISTKANDTPSAVSNKNNTFVFGDVKTSPGSAFVPTSQNIFGGKNSLFSETTASSISTSKPDMVQQKSIFSFTNPVTSVNTATSNVPPNLFSTPTPTLGSTESIQKPFLSPKPSTVATASVPSPKFVFAAPNANTVISSTLTPDNSSKLNFSFASLSTAKTENTAASASTISNAKVMVGSTGQVANNSVVSSFKSLDNNSKSILSSMFTPSPAITKPATTIVTPTFGVKTSEVSQNTTVDSKTFTINPNLFAAVTTTSGNQSSPRVQILSGTKTETPKIITTTAPPTFIRPGSSVTITPLSPRITTVSTIQPPSTNLDTNLNKAACKSLTITITSPVATTIAQPRVIVSSSDVNKSSTFSTISAESVTTAPSIFSVPLSTTSSSLFGSQVTSLSSMLNSPKSSSTPSIFSSTQQPLFGSSQSTSPLFGSTSQKSNTSTPSSTPSIFGGNINTTTPFGIVSQSAVDSTTSGTKSPTTQQQSIFGGTSNIPSTTLPSIFSTSVSSAPTSIIQPSSIFGAPTAITSTTTQPSIFGSPNVLGSTVASSVFGSGTASNSTTQPSIFGSPTTTIASTTQANIFGSVGLTSATPAPLFGANASSSPVPQPPVFGASTTQSSVFGTPAVSSPSGSIFGTTPATESLFSTMKTTAPGIFGSATSTFSTANTTAPSFFTPSSSTTSSIFGQPATFGSGSIFNNPPNTNTGSIFGGTSSSPTNVFGNTATTNTSFGPAFGSSPSNASPFGSATDSFRFATTTGANTSSVGGSFAFNKPPFSSFGGNSNTTDTNSLSFGNLGLSTSSQSSGFGSSAFGQNPFTRTAGQEQPKSPFSGGSIFGSSPATTSSPSSNIFGGSSPFSKTTPAFGGPATFGSSSAFGQQTSSTFGQGAFGGSGSNPFGSSPQPGPFSQGGQTSVNQSGFGAASVFGSSSAFPSSSPGGFGAPPAFGGTPAFGANSNFNASPTKPFPDTFGTSNQQNTTFANLANQSTLGFGSLAQQSQTPTSQSTFSGGSSFSNWR